MAFFFIINNKSIEIMQMFYEVRVWPLEEEEKSLFRTSFPLGADCVMHLDKFWYFGTVYYHKNHGLVKVFDS